MLMLIMFKGSPQLCQTIQMKIACSYIQKSLVHKLFCYSVVVICIKIMLIKNSQCYPAKKKKNRQVLNDTCLF